MASHTLIFIHGMGEGDSSQDYDKLKAKILKQVKDADKFKTLYVEWQSVTFPPERQIFEKSYPEFLPIPASLNASQIILHPIQSVKYFMTFFVGDIIAYTSEPANSNGIRETVWQQISECCESGPYSILAHSLGSIIAFDYLYKLFIKKTLLYPGDIPETNTRKLNRYKKNFRHLFTFGSPIGLFMLRQGILWRTCDPFSSVTNPLPEGHTWLNFYDREDLAAYPLAQLFGLNEKNKNKSLKDVKVNTGNLVVNSHLNYWKNNKMAAEIASVLNANP